MNKFIFLIAILCTLVSARVTFNELYDSCKNGVDSNCSELYDEVTFGCNEGNATICLALGQLYENGVGGRRDYKKAEYLYASSCEDGEAKSCDLLGDLLYYGKGIAQDYSRAFKLYRDSCNSGYTGSCINLGAMYENGQGVEANVTKAFYIYKEACNKNDREACASITELVRNKKMSKEEVKARMYFN